jgi:hypothetical protein
MADAFRLPSGLWGVALWYGTYAWRHGAFASEREAADFAAWCRCSDQVQQEYRKLQGLVDRPVQGYN